MWFLERTREFVIFFMGELKCQSPPNKTAKTLDFPILFNVFWFQEIHISSNHSKSLKNHPFEKLRCRTGFQNSCNPYCKTVLPASTFDTSAILKSLFHFVTIEIFTCHENHYEILIGMWSILHHWQFYTEINTPCLYFWELCHFEISVWNHCYRDFHF